MCLIGMVTGYDWRGRAGCVASFSVKIVGDAMDQDMCRERSAR